MRSKVSSVSHLFHHVMNFAKSTKTHPKPKQDELYVSFNIHEHSTRPLCSIQKPRTQSATAFHFFTSNRTSGTVEEDDVVAAPVAAVVVA